LLAWATAAASRCRCQLFEPLGRLAAEHIGAQDHALAPWMPCPVPDLGDVLRGPEGRHRSAHPPEALAHLQTDLDQVARLQAIKSLRIGRIKVMRGRLA